VCVGEAGVVTEFDLMFT